MNRLKENKTVKKRIFLSNALMILVTLILVMIINVCILKIYWESIEQSWQASMKVMAHSASIGNMLENWTLHQRSFYILLVVDVVVCALIWIFVSMFFTGRLVEQIMIPLDRLREGAKRIRKNDLTTPISYEGDEEFEDICETFNDMQSHILLEQEKNKKYEKARTEMIAGISHDLRTPLTAMKGSIKGILDGVVKEENQEQFLKMAYRRSEDMEDLLNQLFFISKLDTGNMPQHLEKVNLSSWLEEYIEDKRKQYDVKEITFKEDIDDVREMALIDVSQFNRIFDNLIENSIKYAGITPIPIHITLKETKSSYQITYSDSGKGVPEDKINSIFDEFYQVDESRNKQKGNGLGLYIVKSLIEAMNGHVYATNEEGLTIHIEINKGKL